MTNNDQITDQEVQATMSLAAKAAKRILEFLGCIYAIGIAAWLGIHIGDAFGIARPLAAVGGWIGFIIIPVLMVKVATTADKLQREGRAVEA